MAGFAVGHRVVVKPDNGYDRPEHSQVFGVMAGHYGKVVNVLPLPPDAVGFPPEVSALVTVHVLGRVDGPVNPTVMEVEERSHSAGEWLFFPHELEHAD